MRAVFRSRIIISIFFVLVSLHCSCAASVSLFYCNAYPGNYVSIGWGNANSSRIAYRSCASFNVDNTITAGSAWLWSALNTTNPTITNHISILTPWCSDSNRNVIVAYKSLDVSLGITYPTQTGGFSFQNCNALPVSTAVGYILQMACNLNLLNTVDIVANGVVLKSTIVCGFDYATFTANPSAFFSSVSSVSLVSHNNNKTLAGPFSLSNFQQPQADQSQLFIISTNENNVDELWTYTTTGTAPPSSTPPPTPSGAVILRSVYYESLLLIAIVLGMLVLMQ